MKKLLRAIVGILLIVIFLYMGYFLDQECKHKYPNYIPSYMYEIYDIVYSIDVNYVAEVYGWDMWQSPQHTEKYGGDCEDWAIWIGKKLADLKYNIEPVGCVINIWGNSTGHMWVRVYIRAGCCNYDAWDIDMTVEPRIFPARLQYNLSKEEVDRFWNIVLEGE